jgi:hypothetical protein
MPMRIQDGRPSLRPGIPVGSEHCFSRVLVSNPFSRVLKQAPHGWQEESDADTHCVGTRKVYA